MNMSIIHVCACVRACGAFSIIAVIPLHDFIVLLDILFNVGKFALQVLAALLLLEESGVLEAGCETRFELFCLLFQSRK